MNSPFFLKSKEIADKFIQSVLFVDDEIYTDEKNLNNSLNGKELVKVFSKAKKLCALNNPKTESDFDDIIKVAQLADITVLDWRMNLIKANSVTENDEEDEEEDDPRGAFTLKLIHELLQTNGGELKLIMVYTGEPILPQIVDRLVNSLADYEFMKIGENVVGKANFRIVVAGKPTLAGRLNHNPELKSWILQYEQIPDFLLGQFTFMTEGLVSNVALAAITSVRKSSFKILSVFNKNIDPAFLTHRAMLPIVDDAGELLKDSLLTSIKAILDYDEIETICSFPHIAKWIDNNSFSNKILKISKNEITVSKKEIKEWQKKGFSVAFAEIWASQFPAVNIDMAKIETIYKELHKDSLKYFVPDGEDSKAIEEKFSILTHHKSSFANPTYTPKLSLGTIIKGVKSGKYYICIQQKCDSVRLKPNDVRRFLFLPLNVVADGKKFNFLINSGEGHLKLAVDYDTHKIRTIKFTSSKSEAVFARKFGSSSNYFFIPYYYKGNSNYDKEKDENYLWILDLKDDHSQRIANIYASKLSRVGLDESEWLRRWSGN